MSEFDNRQQTGSPDREREIREAIDAGQRALDALTAAENNLGSARNWGLLDMVGGGFFSSLIKHSKVDDAQRCMEIAERELRDFGKELRDVQSFATIQVNFDGLIKFVDVLFDNFLVDLLVQSKIREAQESISQAKLEVIRALSELDAMLDQ